MSTFDDLMKQVASLRAENSSLKRELQNNAGNISQLETEAHSMKDVLSHLQHAIHVGGVCVSLGRCPVHEVQLHCICRQSPHCFVFLAAHNNSWYRLVTSLQMIPNLFYCLLIHT